ncbi:MAG: hypothetical protein GX572_05420 [Clostridia bacterium]|nr:hypothetical protein [Clostridia bacterium]
MKIKGKVFALALALVVVMALLAGCGGDGTPTVSDDPNVGIWQAVTIEMFGEEFPADEIYSDGFVLELKDGGKCELRAEGKKDKYDWSATGDTITVSSRGTAFISAAVSGNVMVIEDFMGTGLKIVLEKEGAGQGADASAAGYYVIDALTIDTEYYDAELLDELGIYYYIILNEDNTAEINTDMLLSGTWDNGKLYYEQDGEDYVNEFVLDGDMLTIEVDDDGYLTIFEFRRSNDLPAAGGDDDSDAATDAAAYFTRAELEGIYDQLSQDYDDRTLSGLSYQEVFDRYFDGVEGTVYLEGVVLTIYQWPASDDAEAYVTVSFQDYQGDGNRTAGGIGSYFP